MRRAPLDWWARRSTPDVVIANSRFTAQSIPPKLQEAPVHVVYGPVPPPGPPNAARREAIRRELATPAAAVVVVMAARFEPWKGHLTLLHALARLRHLSGWLGWVVGGPQRRTELRYSDTLSRTAARLGLADRIRFCGERTDVPSVLQAADLYCQPNSEAEPFGVALVEAMAAGLPVITTGLGGATEIVSDRCGRLVSRGDASSVAAAIETLLGAPERRLRLGRCGRARARVLCDPSQQLQRLHDVLRSSIRSRVDA